MPRGPLHHIIIAGIICAAMMVISTSYAEDIGAPIPTSRKSLIRDLNKDIEKTKEIKQETQKALQDESKTIKNLRGKLVRIGTDIKASENKLNHFDKLLEQLEIEKSKIEADITKQKKALADIIMATQRLKRVPPVTVLLTPGEPLETAQTTMVMRSRLQTIETKRKELQKTIQNYQKTQKDIHDRRRAAQELRNDLNEKSAELSALLDQRQQHYTRQKIVLSEYTKNLNTLASKAQNLKDLVETIETRNRKIANAGRIKDIMLAPEQLPSHGEYQLPVSGFIKTSYGAEDRFGGRAKGYEIESYRGALVVAPFSGQIKYAGPFKNHENIIIIEHKDGYHSLIGGLEKIHVNVGQVIVSGEAIGILGKLYTSQDSQKARGILYYELRRNGSPIDPATKFSDLG